MKTYTLFIKSYTEDPDIEIDVTARSKKQALRYLLHDYPQLKGIDREKLYEYIIDWEIEDKKMEALKRIIQIGGK